jgi:NADH:ubiquinone oxidoreductase subunit C
MRDAMAHPEQAIPDWEPLLSALPGATTVERRGDGLWMAAPRLDVLALADLMRRMEARLTTMTGIALPTGETEILYHYCLGSLMLNIRTETHDHAIPSITPVTQTADWCEREIGDLYGVRFDGHPDSRRLIRPPTLPQGFFRDPGGRRSQDETRAVIPSNPTGA